jgi:hypothetical protein
MDTHDSPGCSSENSALDKIARLLIETAADQLAKEAVNHEAA